MNMPITPQSLIEQILQIQHMEHGSISVLRSGPNGPYYNLNAWENGKNCCRYLPQEHGFGIEEGGIARETRGYNEWAKLC